MPQLTRNDIHVGLGVVINPESNYYYQFIQNAGGTIGRIANESDYYPQDHYSEWIYVNFDNGYGNCYQIEDLMYADEDKHKWKAPDNLS